MKDFPSSIQTKKLNKQKYSFKIHHFLHKTALPRLRMVILFLPAMIFLLVFGVIILLQQGVIKETKTMLLPPLLFSSFRPASYPLTEAFSPTVMGVLPYMSAQAAIVVDNDSKVVLFFRNPYINFPMASTTKIMSALVALEHYKLDDILTVQSTRVQPAVVGYALGENVRFVDILYGMFLSSGNDAALAVAQNYPGGEAVFVQTMNTKAQALSLHNTQFTDSSGLDNGNTTTASDLARLASEAMKNPLLAKIVATKQKTTTNADGSKTYYLTNINELLGRYGVNGIKTGFTEEAGGVLVTSTDQNGHRVIIVILKSDDRFGDTEKVLSLINGKITYLSIAP